MPGAHLAFQHPVTLRLQVQERQVLKLVLYVTYAEPVRERREYLERLPADALLLVRRHRPQRTHVVQPVCQFHEDDAYIADHGQQHLPQVSDCSSSYTLTASLLIFVSPSTIRRTATPNFSSICSKVTSVSSTVSCSRPAISASASRFISASRAVTATGCTM